MRRAASRPRSPSRRCINDLDAARSILTSLQNLGVTIALDDFGTGYSSLYHVSELKFNKLKIDKSYVTTLKQGSERAKLVDAIIQLGASLSLQTTAEGVETDANLNWLSDQGCNFGQGYFFGRPMPKDAADFSSTPSRRSNWRGTRPGPAASPERGRTRNLRGSRPASPRPGGPQIKFAP